LLGEQTRDYTFPLLDQAIELPPTPSPLPGQKNEKNYLVLVLLGI